MGVCFTDLQCKEVICLSNGARLGFVADVQVEVPEGNIRALVVPCPAKGLLPPLHREEYIIPWSAVKRIGPDIVLVDTNPQECKKPRPKGLNF